MKRTIAIKLLVSAEQDLAFAELQELFSRACNRAAEIAVKKAETNRVRLHHLSYYLLREEFPVMGAQMTCSVIGKTSQALKALKKPKEILFRKNTSIHFDKRTYSLKNGVLSLFTLKGRIRIALSAFSFVLESATEYL